MRPPYTRLAVLCGCMIVISGSTSLAQRVNAATGTTTSQHVESNVIPADKARIILHAAQEDPGVLDVALATINQNNRTTAATTTLDSDTALPQDLLDEDEEGYDDEDAEEDEDQADGLFESGTISFSDTDPVLEAGTVHGVGVARKPALESGALVGDVSGAAATTALSGAPGGTSTNLRTVAGAAVPGVASGVGPSAGAAAIDPTGLADVAGALGATAMGLTDESAATLTPDEPTLSLLGGVTGGLDAATAKGVDPLASNPTLADPTATSANQLTAATADTLGVTGTQAGLTVDELAATSDALGVAGAAGMADDELATTSDALGVAGAAGMSDDELAATTDALGVAGVDTLASTGLGSASTDLASTGGTTASLGVGATAVDALDPLEAPTTTLTSAATAGAASGAAGTRTGVLGGGGGAASATASGATAGAATGTTIKAAGTGATGGVTKTAKRAVAGSNAVLMAQGDAGVDEEEGPELAAVTQVDATSGLADTTTSLAGTTSLSDPTAGATGAMATGSELALATDPTTAATSAAAATATTKTVAAQTAKKTAGVATTAATGATATTAAAVDTAGVPSAATSGAAASATTAALTEAV